MDTKVVDGAIYVDGQPEPAVRWTSDKPATVARAAKVFADLRRHHVIHTGPVNDPVQAGEFSAMVGEYTATGPLAGG
jgi:hypothetical protein